MARPARLDAMDLALLAAAAADPKGRDVHEVAQAAGCSLRDARERVVHLRRLALVEPALVRVTARGARVVSLDPRGMWRLGRLGALQVLHLVAAAGPCSIEALADRAARWGWRAAIAEGRPAGSFKRAFDEAAESCWIAGPSVVLASARGIELVEADPVASALRDRERRVLVELQAATQAWLSRTA